MNRKNHIILFVFLSIFSHIALSWTVSDTEFLYLGADSNDSIGSKVWDKTSQTNTGMLDVAVYGRPASNAPGSCPTEINCSSTNCWNSWIPSVDALSQTGLTLPTYYTPKCPNSNWMGFSYFGSSNSNGFSMRTWTGKKPIDETASFWTPYQSAPNKDISAIYATMKPSWIMRPWSASCTGSSCDDIVRVAIITDHEVSSVSAPTGTQLQQTVRVVFVQNQCDIDSDTPCQLEVNVKTLCQGGSCGTKIQGSDPAQGGIPYIAGTINGASGYTYVTNNSSIDVWRSWGSSTLSGTFGKTKFQIEITWNQFKNILSEISYQRGQALSEVFGQDWETKENWVLTAAGFGQEVSNPTPSNNRAYIGGNVQRLRIVAISH